MDTVLGVSVTPTSVRSVLVEGRDADGATLDHDEYDVFEEVGAALAGDRDDAEAAHLNVDSIGVTWSDDAELEASQVLDGMARAGLTGVSAIPLSEAVQALASSIGDVVGYRRTALCVVEPGTAAIAVVDVADDTLDVLISHAIDSEDALVHWVAAALAEGTRPDALFVVGSVPGLDASVTRLEAELALPVSNPPEAEFALAHGAALAAADGVNLPSFDLDVPTLPKRRRNPVVAPMTLLVAGAVTFVVSLSIAVGDQLTPSGGIPTQSREVQKTAGTPPMARPVAPAPVAPPPTPVVAPVVIEEALPPPPPVEAIPPAPAPEFVAPEDTAPAFMPVEVPAAPAPVPAPPPAVIPPPPPMYQAPVQAPERKGLWERFKDKLKPGPDEPEWQLAPGAVPPPGVPIPPG